MRPLGAAHCREILRTHLLFRLSVVALACLAAFYLGRYYSSDASAGYSQLLSYFTSSSSSGDTTHSVAISPNANRTFDISSLISAPLPPPSLASSPAPLPPALPPPPPPPPQRFGIVDENGTMQEDFVMGDFNSSENWEDGNETSARSGEAEAVEGRPPASVPMNKFHVCPGSMMEYIPCLDNEAAIGKLNSTERGERFERHCPDERNGLNCLIPPPKDYKTPIPWPRSRDEVWFSNVPNTRLVEDKGGQNWITKVKDKFRFPGGGTQFIHGADQYLDQISKVSRFLRCQH